MILSAIKALFLHNLRAVLKVQSPSTGRTPVLSTTYQFEGPNVSRSVDEWSEEEPYELDDEDWIATDPPSDGEANEFMKDFDCHSRLESTEESIKHALSMFMSRRASNAGEAM